jgi:hypothetical protein
MRPLVQEARADEHEARRHEGGGEQLRAARSTIAHAEPARDPFFCWQCLRIESCEGQVSFVMRPASLAISEMRAHLTLVCRRDAPLEVPIHAVCPDA